MKKHIAIFMIVLMSVTVISTAGVATAASIDEPYRIDYTGQDLNWKGSQCNYHIAYALDTTTTAHTERSVRNTATISMTARPGQVGYQGAVVGVKWLWISGITPENYYDYDQLNVKVTVDATWNIKVSGGDPNTQVTYGFGGQEAALITGSGTYTAHGPTTFTTTIGGIAAHADGETGLPVGWIQAVMIGTITGTEFTTPQRISGTVTIHSISIQFLDS